VVIGRSAETIVAAARDFGCDRIVFGREEPSLAGRIFGSLAQQVRQLLGASGDLQVIGS
jgi:nucleotide-binding universal stress UspA family protein